MVSKTDRKSGVCDRGFITKYRVGCRRDPPYGAVLCRLIAGTTDRPGSARAAMSRATSRRYSRGADRDNGAGRWRVALVLASRNGGSDDGECHDSSGCACYRARATVLISVSLSERTACGHLGVPHQVSRARWSRTV